MRTDGGGRLLPLLRCEGRLFELGDGVMRFPGMVLIVICLVAGGPLHAAAAQEPKDATMAPETNAGKAAASDKNGSGQSPKPAATFKPSERIRADSAVSFPVDI